jgi:hypothetical protein
MRFGLRWVVPSSSELNATLLALPTAIIKFLNGSRNLWPSCHVRNGLRNQLDQAG